MKNRILMSFLLVLVCLIPLVLWAPNHLSKNKLAEYYKVKAYKEPNPLLIDALPFITKTANAIDLGCGVGNDTAFLLNNGWAVWAIDCEKEAFEAINQRHDINHNARLEVITSKFEELNWTALPYVALMHASNALPYCHPEKFHDVWHQLIAQIVSDGIFVGHFYGPSEDAKPNMTHLSREELMGLFHTFDLILFREKEVEGMSIFEVVARKK